MVQQAVTPHGASAVVVSLVCFTLVYAVLAVIWSWLMMRYARAGAHESPPEHDESETATLSFAY
jgi:cytochrome bd ubiquinol oxidase subunit I